MSTAKTPAQLAAANYRLAVFRAKQRGQPIPDRETHIAEYLARSQQSQKSPQAAPLAVSMVNDKPRVSTEPPTPHKARLEDSGKAHAAKQESIAKDETPDETGSETAAGEVMRAEGQQPPDMPSDTPPRAKVTPARLPNGRFPSRRPLCQPAAPEQYNAALSMMETGETCAAIQKATGATWLAIQERGLADHPHDWPALVMAWRETRAARLVDRAQQIALQESPAEVSETSGPMGTTTTERRKTDPGMLTAALAGLLPEIHGKAAGRYPAVTVNATNAAIFGGPAPAGTLDDWTPEGLLE